MRRVASRARALGLLATYALAQSTSQPDLLIIVRHLAHQAARFWCSLLSGSSGWRTGCTVFLSSRLTNHFAAGETVKAFSALAPETRAQQIR
jgi:hypothetical protein